MDKNEKKDDILIPENEPQSKVVAPDGLKKSSFKIRTITGFMIFALTIGVLFIPIPAGYYVMQAVLLILTLIGVYEMVRMFEKEKKFGIVPMIFVFVLTVVTFLNVRIYEDITYGVLVEVPENFMLIGIKIDYLSLILAIVVIIFALTVFCKNFDSKDASKVLTIILYIGYGMTSLMILRLLGAKFFVYALLISSVTDVFAYLGGSIFGKHKMIPRISPKKSWEGAIIGTVLATMISSSFALFYGAMFAEGTWLGDFFNVDKQNTLLDNFSIFKGEPFTHSDGAPNYLLQASIIVPVTLIGSIVTQLGDLVASKMKRTYDVKDFGSIFPGHGGVLDRFDSIIFVSMFLVGIFLIFSNLST